MSFKSQLKLGSRFFNSSERRKAFGESANQAAQNFRQSLKQKMIDSVPAGRVDIIGEGSGFQTRFRRSRRGQRPAIQTRRLLNSIRAKRTGDLSSEVTVIAETDEGFNYGEDLQQNLGRKILTAEDEKEAEKDFNRRSTSALLGLL